MKQNAHTTHPVDTMTPDSLWIIVDDIWKKISSIDTMLDNEHSDGVVVIQWGSYTLKELLEGLIQWAITVSQLLEGLWLSLQTESNYQAIINLLVQKYHHLPVGIKEKSEVINQYVLDNPEVIHETSWVSKLMKLVRNFVWNKAE